VEAGQKIRRSDEIARRMIEAFQSDLGVFVFDKNILDYDVVKRLITMAGVEAYLNKTVYKDIIIYSIKRSLVEARCRQIKCRGVPPAKIRACIAECYREMYNTIVNTIVRNLKEAKAMLVE
jgi:hypothetical protein